MSIILIIIIEGEDEEEGGRSRWEKNFSRVVIEQTDAGPLNCAGAYYKVLRYRPVSSNLPCVRPCIAGYTTLASAFPPAVTSSILSSCSAGPSISRSFSPPPLLASIGTEPNDEKDDNDNLFFFYLRSVNGVLPTYPIQVCCWQLLDFPSFASPSS
jgi:hypothetical protein